MTAYAMDLRKSADLQTEVNQLSEKEVEILKSSVASDTVVEDEAPPTYSECTTITLTRDIKQAFTPGRSLYINSRGIGMIRFPTPSSELEIPIYNQDGSLAYVSTRDKRCSGDAVLSSPNLGNLLITTYFFGPGRHPVLSLLYPTPFTRGSPDINKDITVAGKFISRSADFDMPDGSKFEWRYVPLGYDGGGRSKLLVLEKIEGKGNGSRKRVAQLLRTKQTIPQGSSKHRAGCGGELVLDQNAHLDIDETVIVGTCLLMLKREVDRRRAIQMMVMTGVVAN
ncbi:hypothetical protein TMEN_2056 [Trichophyton mentagrophytes]|uniref:Uncharacterized protein n=1 Tax=Trichophyton interdigitale (strain MR816) TaxID=1215338 RepID=A0A059JH36_TRIIM|nr:hypothetical protein H101_01333 [Trichophyton interdigitale H6]KDB26777.1 hypothetical protein H109_01454 [Trichophyton interdigitale MR816]GBF59766.1 hypothetical protein TMEN_2056 [Trichophyton mentagrophytes]